MAPGRVSRYAVRRTSVPAGPRFHRPTGCEPHLSRAARAQLPLSSRNAPWRSGSCTSDFATPALPVRPSRLQCDNAKMNSVDYEPREFQLLCAALLAAEGCFNVEEASSLGVDWVCQDPRYGRVLVAAKQLKQPVFHSELRRLVLDLRNARLLFAAEHALLIVSTPLTAAQRATAAEGLVAIDLWSGAEIEALLKKHPDVQRKIARLREARSEVTAPLVTPREDAHGEESQQETFDPATSLIRRLLAVPIGPTGWREYERVTEEILTFIFVPPLRVPRPQTASEDGLDRRDLIFPLGVADPFGIALGWSSRRE